MKELDYEAMPIDMVDRLKPEAIGEISVTQKTYTADEVMQLVREFLRSHREPNQQGQRILKSRDWMILGVVNLALNPPPAKVERTKFGTGGQQL